MAEIDDKVRAELIDAIDFALRLKVRLPGRWRDEVASRLAARAIVDQLLQSNFEVRRAAPAPWHKTH